MTTRRSTTDTPGGRGIVENASPRTGTPLRRGGRDSDFKRGALSGQWSGGVR